MNHQRGKMAKGIDHLGGIARTATDVREWQLPGLRNVRQRRQQEHILSTDLKQLDLLVFAKDKLGRFPPMRGMFPTVLN